MESTNIQTSGEETRKGKNPADLLDENLALQAPSPFQKKGIEE